MSKYMFIQEHLRVDHTIQHQDGSMTIDFLKASAGKQLLKKVRGVDIDPKDIDYGYMYPKVPEVAQVTKGGKPISYKDVTAKKAKPYEEQLIDKIIETKPEVVIPNGKLGCKFFAGEVSIVNTRGKPVQKTVENADGESHTFWVLPMYSMEYVSARPGVEEFLDIDLKLLSKYNEEGESVFIPSKIDYEFVTDFEKVKEIFRYIEENNPTTSWDLETNTLKPEMNGSKAIVISITWEEKKGFTIPMEHKSFSWEEGQLEELLEMINAYVASKNHYKVGANTKFDIRFLMSAYGMTEFHNHLDIQIGYWMGILQGRQSSKRLGDMAHQFTDMGGYDKELEDWIKEYKREYRKEHKKTPENEIDGSDFNYEWIPLEMLANYAAGDVDATLRIHNVIWEEIKKNEKWINLYTDFYPRLTTESARTESRGLHLDLDYAKVIAKEYKNEEERLLNELRSLPSVKVIEDEYKSYYEAGLEQWAIPKAERDLEIAKWRDKYKNKLAFNPNSSDDKSKLLFDVLDVKLPFNKDFVKDGAWKKKRPRRAEDLEWNDYSTGKDTIEELVKNIKYPEEVREVAGILQQITLVSKLRSSFGERAQTDVADDGAIHGRMNIVGTATGRISMSDPK